MEQKIDKRKLPKSQEMRDRISKKLKGRKLSDMQKIRISLGGKGLKRPPGTGEKISRATKGKKRSEESRKKMSAWQVGRTIPEKTRKKMSEARTGCKNPLWKGGISFGPYCPKFNNEFKERVRKFFNYTCMLCGKKQEEFNEKLHVHHVNFKKEACCDQNITPLFVPLCRSCHSKTGNRNSKYEKYFIAIINEQFNGKCYLPKEEQ
jgi:5-methylcytosine-specific restriction endonuclease McrA